jgi:hypothetical protein
MVHKVRREKEREAKSLFIVRLSAIQKVIIVNRRGEEGASYS